MRRLLKFIDQNRLTVFVLVVSDTFWYVVSFLLAYFVRNNIWPTGEIQPILIYLRVLPLVLLLMIGIFYVYGLYEQKNRINKISEIYLLIKSLTICLVLIMAGSFLQKYDYSRILVILFWIFSIICLNFGRFLLRRARRYLLKRGYGLSKILIIGAGKVGKKIAYKLENYRDFGYQIVGFLDDHVSPQTHLPYPLLGPVSNLIPLLETKTISQVFIADPALSHETILSLIQSCEQFPVKIKVVSDLFEIIAGGLDINEIEEIPSLDFQKNTGSYVYLFVKRFLDIVLSSLSLLLFAPFGLIIIIFLKLDSPGPIFFSQERVGKNGRPFLIYKFRTMHQDVLKEAYSPKSLDDKRITAFGRLLRRTSLDEIPQLWNVLIGDMSLVGPRPEMPFIVAKYKPWQRKRLEVKPGLTGLWQILGRKDLPLLDNIEYDFYYIKNQSILLDLVIMVKTVMVVLGRKGAY